MSDTFNPNFNLSSIFTGITMYRKRGISQDLIDMFPQELKQKKLPVGWNSIGLLRKDDPDFDEIFTFGIFICTVVIAISYKGNIILGHFQPHLMKPDIEGKYPYMESMHEYIKLQGLEDENFTYRKITGPMQDGDSQTDKKSKYYDIYVSKKGEVRSEIKSGSVYY